jgi:hypothetical protein
MNTRNRGRSGSTLLEFALAGTFVFLPLLVGCATVGMAMLKSIQVVEVNRAAGHMFSQGVDFSQAGNKNILLQIASGLGITAGGGQGVIILSEIDGTGANAAVCSRRIVVGNPALHASNYVNPSSSLLDSSGAVTNLNDPSANAASFTPSVMPMSSGSVAYLAETYLSTSQYDWTGILTGTGIYTKSVF